MNKFSLRLNGLFPRILKNPRKWRHSFKARNFKGNTPCIICNNCLGAIILHDLGLPFNTPTVNLFFSNSDEYLYFVNHLAEFQNLDFIDLKDKYNYPAGQLEFDGHTIDVVFMHYSSFEHGRSKWLERMNRVKLEDVFILYESPQASPSFIENFSKIKFKKALISIPSIDYENKYEFYIALDIYKDWHPGKVLEYKSLLSLSRWIDDWDYIEYLKYGKRQ